MPKSDRKRLEKLAKKRKKRKQIVKTKLLAEQKERARQRSEVSSHSMQLSDPIDWEDNGNEANMVHINLLHDTIELQLIGDAASQSYHHLSQELSDLLWQYIFQDIEVLPESIFDVEKVVMLYALSWNIASSSVDMDGCQLHEHPILRWQLPNNERIKEFYHLIEKMREEHPAENRIIAGFQLTQLPDGYDLRVETIHSPVGQPQQIN